MSVQPAGHWPGVGVTPLALGTSLPCVGGPRPGSGTPASLLAVARLCWEVTRQPPAVPALFLSPRVLGDLWVFWGCDLGGCDAVPPAPNCVLALSLPRWVSVGVVVHVQVSAAPRLPCSIPLRKVPGSRGNGSPHHTMGRVAPAAPKRDRGVSQNRSEPKTSPCSELR